MSERRRRAAIVSVVALLVLAASGSAPPAPRAQPAEVTLTVNRAMVKGPAEAPVTIVEFSDYQ